MKFDDKVKSLLFEGKVKKVKSKIVGQEAAHGSPGYPMYNKIEAVELEDGEYNIIMDDYESTYGPSDYVLTKKEFKNLEKTGYWDGSTPGEHTFILVSNENDIFSDYDYDIADEYRF